MSFRHVAAVLDHYPNGDARKLVLVALAEQANEATWICWPSVERLAKRACISERHALRTIDTLEEEGVIDVVRGGRGRSRKNRYRIRFDALKRLPSLIDVDTPEADPESGFEPLRPVDNPVDNLCKETGQDVTYVREKVTSETGKGDIAMSPKPERTRKDPHAPARESEPGGNHGEIVVRELVSDLAASWSAR